MAAASGRLILASTSIYRAQLLRQIGLDFDCVAPEVIEDELPDETPPDRALRLALAKAAAVAQRFPHATVIGSDQVAACGERLLHKPGSRSNQITQLLQSSDQLLSFHTALCVIDSVGARHNHVNHTQCRLRALSAGEVNRYVSAEAAVDCAGGFRIEALGITLFDSVRSDDPSALIGLPLIALARILRTCGWKLP